MSPATYSWVLAGHLIGVVLWMGALFAVYWLLRVHAHAPKDVHDKLTLMERSLAMSMDIAAAAAIGCGLAMSLSPVNLFKVTDTNKPWLHIKLTLVVLAILSVHGMVRARVKKFSQGKVTPMPQWAWSLLLVGIVGAIICATTKLNAF